MSTATSFWEKYKLPIFQFGHIYATLFGLVMINYQSKETRRTHRTLGHRIAVVYSHILNALLILVLPVYFGCSFSDLITSADRDYQLLLVVNFVNTFIKYATVVVTYIANHAHYTAIMEITRTSLDLEDAFAPSNSSNAKTPNEQPRVSFERLLMVKFGFLLSMMLVQMCILGYQVWTLGIHAVRVHFAVYTFVLWNYTENMADYFYYINTCAWKYFMQLEQQLQLLVKEASALQRSRRGRKGTTMQVYCTQCDRLDVMAQRYIRISKLYADSVRMHEFQMLGMVLSTLINNLTNFFTLFNLFAKPASAGLGGASPAIALSIIYAFIFYVDTYMVVLISEYINDELQRIGRTVREFNELPNMDVRLEQTIEHFSLAMVSYRFDIRICGLFGFDRRLTYLAGTTAFSYFITLIQFSLSLSK